MTEPKEVESSTALATRIADHLSNCVNKEVTVKSAKPLSGGACQDNFVVVTETIDGSQRFVLRSDANSSLMNSIPRRLEAPVVNVAVARKVCTPPALWPTEGLVRDGASCYFMPWVQGVAIGRKVIAAPELETAREGLTDDLAGQLAKIHSVKPSDEPTLFAHEIATDEPANTALQHLIGLVERLKVSRPAMARIVAWLQTYKPAPEAVVLNHGDFRTGNFMVTAGGLSGILDWEFSHWGSPAEDLAWICVRDWRFGRLDRPVGGFGVRRKFLAAYEAAGGCAVTSESLLWWEIMGNARWAVGAVQQAVRYLSGQERDLEYLAIGRRTVEMEWEALRLMRTGVPRWRVR